VRTSLSVRVCVPMPPSPRSETRRRPHCARPPPRVRPGARLEPSESTSTATVTPPARGASRRNTRSRLRVPLRVACSRAELSDEHHRGFRRREARSSGEGAGFQPDSVYARRRRASSSRPASVNRQFIATCVEWASVSPVVKTSTRPPSRRLASAPRIALGGSSSCAAIWSYASEPPALVAPRFRVPPPYSMRCAPAAHPRLSRLPPSGCSRSRSR
jgi:hypothetical protein